MTIFAFEDDRDIRRRQGRQTACDTTARFAEQFDTSGDKPKE